MSEKTKDEQDVQIAILTLTSSEHGRRICMLEKQLQKFLWLTVATLASSLSAVVILLIKLGMDATKAASTTGAL